ncbi:MAG: adenylyl-sulfate reductase [Magnetococcales bacterium]|nr:adenylyl-sulfate reductase [Magnetococcales bacterium]
MIGSNPFAELSSLISPSSMQTYVVIMIAAVVVGVMLDLIHKKSATYFFENAEKAKQNRKRDLDDSEKMSIAIQTVLVDVLTSGEFNNQNRRLAHMLKMLGFVTFVITTIILIFSEQASSMVAVLWHVGAAMVTVGGSWFWFTMRVNGSSEGQPWTTVVKGDAFILSLVGTTFFGLVWSFLQSSGSNLTMMAFSLFLISSTLLFGGVRWSKFAHMFFKPAAAYQKRIAKADGSNENLPELGSLTDPDLQKRYPDIPEYMGSNPPNMGLGIKREAPKHY